MLFHDSGSKFQRDSFSPHLEKQTPGSDKLQVLFTAFNDQLTIEVILEKSNADASPKPKLELTYIELMPCVTHSFA